MKLLHALVAACLSAVAASALAVQSFSLTMAGTGSTIVDGNVCQTCGGLVVPFAWTGTIDVTTSSGADGVYSGSDLVSFTGQAALTAPVQYAVFGFQFATDGTGAGGFIVPPAGPPVVTIGNGLVTSIDATGSFHPGDISFNGLHVAYGGFFFRSGTTSSSGILTNVSAVPEPETYAMLLLGLVGIGFVARKRKADPLKRLARAGGCDVCASLQGRTSASVPRNPISDRLLWVDRSHLTG
jgi:PEP-CTERM motif